MEQNTVQVLADTSLPMAAAPGNAAGSALFVINLCASMAPIAAGKTLPGLESYRLYQVSRAEDGRTRHRLRLGFFTSEADAEKTLASVRDQYPTAFTACLADEDQRFARGYVGNGVTHVAPVATRTHMSVVVDNDSTRPVKALQIAPAVVAAAAAVVQPVVAKAVVIKAPAAPISASISAPTAPLKPATTIPSPAVESPVIEIDWEPATPTAVVAKSAATAMPTTADDAFEIEMSWDAPKAASAAPEAATSAPIAPIARALTPTLDAPVATQSVAPVAAAPAIELAKAPPVSVARTVTPVAPAPAATPAASLELASSTAPLSSGAAPAHRGVIAAKAPAMDAINLTLDNSIIAAPQAPPTSKAAQPFHVGKGVDLPASSLTLDADASVAKKIAGNAAVRTLAPVARAAEVPASNAKAKARAASLDLDSTQTIRALTQAELTDDSQEKWFAIQLAVSEQPMNLDAMPHLDIFEAYRLYSIASAGSGKITHAMRIGFFREEVSAEAVSGYLKTFFPSPTIVRISVAEHARFMDPPEGDTQAAPTSNNADGKVVEMSAVRARGKSTIPTVTLEVEAPINASATGSFKPNATGSFKPNATGSFKPNATGSFQPNATGSFKPSATGAHKAVKVAAKSAAVVKRAPSAATNRKLATGKHQALTKKPLSQQLIEEAREVELSESGIRKLPKSGSLLARLVGKLSK